MRATGASSTPATGDERRLFPTIDRYFFALVALELLAFPFVPLLPLGIAAASLATPVRGSAWRSVVVWAVGAALGLIVAAPFVLGLFDLRIVQEGPVHTISP